MGLLAVAACSQVFAQTIQAGTTIRVARELNRLEHRQVLPAKRGSILSIDGEVLSENDDRATLSINVRQIPKSPGFFLDLSRASGIPAADLSDRVMAAQKIAEWSKPLTKSQQDAIGSVKTRWIASGISIERGVRRSYPLGPAASTLVGWFQEIAPKVKKGEKPDLSVHLVPTNGIERLKNDDLAGSPGVLIGLTDRSGGILPGTFQKGSTEAVKGSDIVLTINAEVQRAAYNGLKRTVEYHGARNGVAIACDPKTGNVIAMAQFPSPDPGRPDGLPVSRPQGGEVPLALQSVLEPGSVLKIFSVASAYDEGKIDDNSTWRCTSSFVVNNRVMHCAHRKAHGIVNPEKGIADSCNYAASMWSRAVGWDHFTGFLEGSGMISRTGLELPGESVGFYNNQPTPLTLATMGFGQSIATTPAALMSALTMFGNNGTPMKLRLVDSIGGEKQPIVPMKQSIKPETASWVLGLMEAVFDSGTAKKLQMPGYRLGGKTGTAEKQGKGGYVSNFVGFVPSRDPEAVILVMVDDPTKNGYYGGDVAGPVFTDIAKAIIRGQQIRRSSSAGDAAANAPQ